jgi:hypothetical protein
MAWSIFTQGGGKGAALTWAEDLLNLIGAPLTPGNEQFVYDWEVSEGGGGKFNPLNQGPVPGHPELTTTGSQFGGGAADFASWQAGLTGSADYLGMSSFTAIASDLKANNPTGARSALIASPWAASHYGGGAAFSNAALPGKASVLPADGGGVSGGSGASSSTDSFNPLSPSTWLAGIASAFGVSDIKELLERVGLVILGGTILLLGVFLLTGKDAGKVVLAVAKDVPK